jgi:ribosomal protein S18 acetylase RimI-like enzyme
MGTMVLVRQVTADDWELMRDTRLAALADAPSAFGSSYAREARFTEEQWRGRFSERSVAFFAHDDSADRGAASAALASTGPASTGPASTGPATALPAGLAGVYVQDSEADLVSMWVHPSARGLGVGEALVAAAAAWAKARGYPTLFLWVTESNAPARRLYDRLGFTLTGESQPLPSDPALPELRMSRVL